ncbi:DNA translocase FtsK 4TM domain-containing protein [Candidatus Palauibacter polyketidifaciens]|uniref:FtsK/SpoIIIE family DNA translocase n=1 Tax=Candidatus Palauibacter polyketidifaciens TaxID=3056740 RepID=UPI0023A47547|nr:DNA translocase FtsK 4TM domain-containing protein [Candidatus Palauibacter polyketidifaciens]MDE2721026.1 DNA translocase FtsK [Candidatus Palauibacter polyketidifaciens]
MVDERQRREVLGVALILLGLLVAFALLSPLVAGRANWIGPAGELLHDNLERAVGVLSPLVAVPAFMWGLHFLGWGDPTRALRWSVLSVVLLAVLPSLYRLIAGPGPGSAGDIGWLGATAGDGLAQVFGRVGGVLLAAGVLVLTLFVTMRWSLTSAVTAGGRSLRRGVAAAGGAVLGLGRSFAGRARPSRSPRPPAKPDPPNEAKVKAATGRGRAAKKRKPAKPASAPPEPDPAPEDETPPVPELKEAGDPGSSEVPPIQLFDEPTGRGSGLGVRDLDRLGEILIEKLATFRVAGEIGGWTTGPVVTQFEVVPAPGVKVGQISARADDIALALKAPSVRIVAPIPGKGAVGVEVPNPASEIVLVREILESPSYRRGRHALPLALGRDLSGKPTCADLTRMPHLLIAGQTGSGKSVCINALITSLVCRYTPAELRLLMVDPKMVELSVYGDLPHLRHPVITDNEEAASVLKWSVYEMKRRFGLLSANGCRNVAEFNGRIAGGREVFLPKRGVMDDPALYDEGPLPYIVLIIDELADLMMTVQSEVETPLAMLAQKARAVGIHLVLATQRPSVNVLTGLIKANIPSRIAFRVASKIDSRTILDQNGAESLLGNGDMLFLPPGESDPVRIQGAYISSKETERLLDWYREQAKARAEAERAEEEAASERDILDLLKELEEEEGGSGVSDEGAEDRDPLFRQAAEIVISHAAGSTSLLQRRLKIGYGRAARIIDQLHAAGIVGPAEGSKPREVLATLGDLDAGNVDEP